MTVKSILGKKGRDVVTIDPHATVGTAAKLLAERGIGAVVVLGADHRVVGILSERDIVHAIAARGTAALIEPLAAEMTRNVFTCRESETVSVIMEEMTARKFRHIPVVENDRLVGIISIGDVVKHRLQEMAHESEVLTDYIRTA